MKLEFGKILSVIVLTALLSACGGGGAGGGSGDNPSRITDQGGSTSGGSLIHGSPDIYNISSYDAVTAPSDEGMYVLVHTGLITYTLQDTDENTGEISQTNVRKNIGARQVVELRRLSLGGDLHVIDPCTGIDFGSLNAEIPFVRLGGDAHFSGTYTKFYSVAPLDVNERPNPLYGLYFTQETLVDPTINLNYDLQINLHRIGDAGSGIGIPTLTYSVNGVTHSENNACIIQSHIQMHSDFVGKPAPNQADTVIDLIGYSKRTFDLTLSMFSGDAIIVGVGPLGTGSMAAFYLHLDSNDGSTFYHTQELTKHGETGAVSQSMIANDTWGLEFTGQAINDGSADFDEGSANITYHLKWRLH